MQTQIPSNMLNITYHTLKIQTYNAGRWAKKLNVPLRPRIVLPSLCRNAWNPYKTLNLLSDAVCSSREVGSSAVKKRHYSCSNPEHQARSIIFLKNHYCCVLPCGWSSGRENRSSGMTISSDLITSGAKPDNGKWFLVLNVSVCQIHDWTKIVLMNSWHSKKKKNRNSSFGMRLVKGGCRFCVCEQNDLQVLGHIQYDWCEEVIKCYLSSSSL